MEKLNRSFEAGAAEECAADMQINRLCEVEQQLLEDKLEIHDVDDIVNQVTPAKPKYMSETLLLADFRNVQREEGLQCLDEIIPEVARGIIALTVGHTKDKRWINDRMESYGWFFIEAISGVLNNAAQATLVGKSRLGNLFRTSHLTTLLFRRQSESGVPRWIPLRVTHQRNDNLVLVETSSAVFVRVMRIMEDLLPAATIKTVYYRPGLENTMEHKTSYWYDARDVTESAWEVYPLPLAAHREDALNISSVGNSLAEVSHGTLPSSSSVCTEKVNKVAEQPDNINAQNEQLEATASEARISKPLELDVPKGWLEKIKKVRNSQDMDTQQVKMLGKLKDPIPILFQDVEKDFDDTFEEVGYGEGIAENIAEEEDPQKTEAEYAQEERLELLDMAKTKIDQVDDLSDEDKQRLLQVIDNNIEAFGSENSRCRMSLLQPMRVQLKNPHPPIMAQGRSLGQEQTMFLRKKLKKMEELGIVQTAKNPTYGSPAFVVPKKGPKRWRMVIDLRELNK